MVLPVLSVVLRLLISVSYLLCIVLADSSSTSSTDSKHTNKRGINGFSGVPGVLYSQYSPQFQPVPVPHPFPVPVPQPVPIHVPKPFPVTVHKPVGLPVPVGVPVPVQVPVPRPYPVPVPLNLAHNAGGSLFGSSPFGAPLGDFGGPFHQSMFSSSALGSLGKLGYGLGVYSPGLPSLPMAPPGLAAALGAGGHSSSFPGTGLLQGLSGTSPLANSLGIAGHSPKY